MLLIGLALLLALGGYWAIQQSVETVNDRILGAAAQAITEALSVENGEIVLDLPPSAFAILEDAERDNVYYRISRGGRVISGYADLPNPRDRPEREAEVSFASGHYRGNPVRIAAEGRKLPRIAGLVTVEVAETMDARDRVVSRMLVILSLVEILLISVSAILIPAAARWGLSPLHALRREIDRRKDSDFTPLPMSRVPQELHEFVGAFNGLLGRLDVAVQGMRRFTADASHQMRTPLSILRAHVAALRKADQDRAQSLASLADIDEATVRLQNLLVQLLALAKADSAASISEEMRALDLVEVTRQVATDSAVLALRHKGHLQFAAAAPSLAALGHPALVAELLANLLDNAIRYNRAGGLVSVEVAAMHGAPLVRIDDEGPGIPAADRERAFERFTRLHPELGKEGSGLGLSIARSLAEAMGAEITFVGRLGGQGLRVEVRFRSAT